VCPSPSNRFPLYLQCNKLAVDYKGDYLFFKDPLPLPPDRHCGLAEIYFSSEIPPSLPRSGVVGPSSVMNVPPLGAEGPQFFFFSPFAFLSWITSYGRVPRLPLVLWTSHGLFSVNDDWSLMSPSFAQKAPEKFVLPVFEFLSFLVEEGVYCANRDPFEGFFRDIFPSF